MKIHYSVICLILNSLGRNFHRMCKKINITIVFTNKTWITVFTWSKYEPSNYTTRNKRTGIIYYINNIRLPGSCRSNMNLFQLKICTLLRTYWLAHWHVVYLISTLRRYGPYHSKYGIFISIIRNGWIMLPLPS